jgi:hypothetical protein
MLRPRAVSFAALAMAVAAFGWWFFASGDGLPPYRPQQLLPARTPRINVPTKRAGQIQAGEVGDDELVLGVEIEGEARAYPINQLSGPDRELFNETLGGRAIAITWCDLCHNAIVYLREVKDQTLTFYISGKLWQKSAVLIDAETGSEWSHLLGRAMKGRLKGTKLLDLPSVVMTWRQWKADHPDTTVSVLKRTESKYVPQFYGDPSPFAVGLRRGGKAVAYTLAQLQRETSINDTVGGEPVLIGFDRSASGAVAYSRSLDGEVLEFEAEDGQLVGGDSRWSLTTGRAIDGPWQGKRLKPLPLVIAYRDAWERFYPRSRWWHGHEG